MLLTCSLPHTRYSKTVLDFRFHAVGSRFQVLDFEFFVGGFQIPKGFQGSRFSFLVGGKAPPGISVGSRSSPMLGNAAGLECLIYRNFVASPWSCVCGDQATVLLEWRVPQIVWCLVGGGQAIKDLHVGFARFIANSGVSGDRSLQVAEVHVSIQLGLSDGDTRWIINLGKSGLV